MNDVDRAVEVSVSEGLGAALEPAARSDVATEVNVVAATAVAPSLVEEANDWTNLQVVPLHNPADPRWILKREREEHRIIVFLKAQGHTNGEIAQRTGYCKATVANVIKQPWARSIILAEITKAGRDQVETVLQGEALESVLKLIDIRDSTAAPVETQRKAANDILDRVYGKPNTPVTHSDADVKTLTDKQLMEIARRGMTTSTLSPSN